MPADRLERRLAAVLCLDMVGYSLLMEADEEGTIARQKAHRTEVIDPKIAAHSGRIVKSTGDGLLVEFASVVDAVGCAVDIQASLAEFEANSLHKEQIKYRVGINLGDVVVEGSEIYGDGVNIAVRLESFADPGGICISELVHSQIVGKIGVKFSGGQDCILKNITRPVQVWRWPGSPQSGPPIRRRAARPAMQRPGHRIRNVVNVRPLDVSAVFKGRQRETKALRDYLADPLVHMVSILGRGGMGKTALATRVLADLESGQLNGSAVQGIVYLAAKSMRITLERLYADVGRMFDDKTAEALRLRWGNPVMSLRAKAEYLIETMTNGLYIILLDNLEDELEADGTIEDEGLRIFVEQALIEPSGVRLVVTSRQKVRLPPAALRFTRAISLEGGLAQQEAIALLKELDPQGTLGIRDAPRQLLRRASQLTRGIPRALELLAGLLYEDPTTDLATLISDKSLFGTEVMSPLVAVGYKHLRESERRLMEALAVFNEQVDEHAIAHLIQPWVTGPDVHAGLRRLVNGYFVKYHTDTRTYSLHQLDRDYAYEQIPEAS
ncbi:MAG: adenylate/guanylate cyclase domain-containing protein [Kiloniellales bacterium]|nr:adenylate/guanylate cyclase domain-containing protein [Kiloniellales bacterium]